MVKGKKITKKKLKEPDEFITLTQKTLLFIEAHLKKVVSRRNYYCCRRLGSRLFPDLGEEEGSRGKSEAQCRDGGLPESEFSVPRGIALRI